MAALTIPDAIHNAINEAFKSKPKTLSRILFFLCNCLVQGVADTYIHSLQKVLHMPDVFKQVVERMAEDTKKQETDPEYRKFMNEFWKNFNKLDLDENQESNFPIPEGGVMASIQYAFLRAVTSLPPATFKALQEATCSSSLALYRTAGAVAIVNLLQVYLAYDIIKNIHRWWKGEITGSRCVKNITDNGVAVAAGVAGGWGGKAMGAAIGGIFGPVGAGIGAVTGAVTVAYIASTQAKAISETLTGMFFGLPKTEAEEKAYEFLYLTKDATNGEINTRYRRLALAHHPDKGGDPDKWMRLQYSMAIVREARGEGL